MVILGLTQPVRAQVQAPDEALAASVEEIRHSIGRWNVVTEFLNEDGTVARVVDGTYEFSWVVPDRVASGKTETPELQRAAGILFYIRASKHEIEMVSVAADGRLWVMTGPLGGSERFTQEYETTDGGKGRLRFTRFNVSPDAFESKMDYTEDGGRTWKPGNHQQFRRAPVSGP
jgi:hypothetical protein